jgi:hypothetical protein
MVPWIARLTGRAAWRRIPWSVVWAVCVWLVQKGRQRVEDNLTRKEQEDLLRLVMKSKGRPRSLPQRDRTRLRDIARKAMRG